eukprot:2682393-Ditylum_brightwellii.AAC.1
MKTPPSLYYTTTTLLLLSSLAILHTYVAATTQIKVAVQKNAETITVNGVTAAGVAAVGSSAGITYALDPSNPCVEE